MFKNLKSRKLWITILIAVANIALPAIGVPAAALAAIVKIGAVYVASQGAVDVAEALRGE